jgi:miniconductance mechanosensitive channel
MLVDILIRLGIAVLLTAGAYLLTRYLLARIVLPLLHRHWPTWAIPVERSRLPMLTSLLMGALVLYVASGLLTEGYPQFTELLRLLDAAVGIGLLALMLSSAASVALEVYEQKPLAKEVPLRGFVQLMQVLIFLIGGLMIVMTFFGVPPIYSFTALAALFTALGFVFQDPIMGFVAGIQLAANKMVAIGDWIEVPQYGANGAVQEILMSTVKVQNWDNTITTVPARALISDSFKSWRAMYASGGRRLQRGLLLDVHSVQAVTPALLAGSPLAAQVQAQVASGGLAAGAVLVADASTAPTNLGLYRVYLTGYLNRHPRVHQQMTRLVRQLQPAEDGLPLEITVYLLDTDWIPFETASSSIFEHMLATLPDFGLRPYQRAMSPAPADAAAAADTADTARANADASTGSITIPSSDTHAGADSGARVKRNGDKHAEGEETPAGMPQAAPSPSRRRAKSTPGAAE